MNQYHHMWIKQLPPTYLHRRSEMINLNGLWRNNNIYVMDNHRAAAWCWLQTCNPSSKYNFLHIDQHGDLMLDSSKGIWATYQKVITNPELSIDEYLMLRHQDSINALAFRWDNYIRPIHGLLPNWFQHAFFAYTQNIAIEDYERNYENSLHKGFSGSAKRLCSSELMELLTQIPYMQSDKWIINLDLDYFFAKIIKQNGDSFIEEFAHLLNVCLTQTQVLTIALSPSCCNGRSIIGGWRNSIQVFNKIKEHITSLSDCIFPI